MKHRFDGYNHVVRLERGEKLMESLAKLAESKKLGSVWLSGIGAAVWLEVGAYSLDKKDYNFQRFDEPMEIAHLQGDLTWNDDQPFWHIHGSFSARDLKTVSGHVQDLEVGATCELFLHTIFGDRLSRVKSEDIGLKLLDV